jgi:hypothetical protein
VAAGRSSPAVAEEAPHHLDVIGSVSSQPAGRRGGQVTGTNDHEAKAVGRELLLATLVVEAPLLTAVDAAHRQAIGLVEVSDGLVVLPLSIFDDQSV